MNIVADELAELFKNIINSAIIQSIFSKQSKGAPIMQCDKKVFNIFIYKILQIGFSKAT